MEAAYAASDAPTFVEATAHVDVQTYLPDDLLVKMDIASMAHSLELRSPFLDQDVVEFAASLPLSLKLRGMTQKYLLKTAMTARLPRPVIRRKKMGFGVPLDHWFRNDLKELAHDVLLSPRATARGYFKPDVLRRYLQDHTTGQAHHHFRLWNLLVLELWHQQFIDQQPASSPAQTTEIWAAS
jgi:asparagine synthase (glutamine-hydrolysing)